MEYANYGRGWWEYGGYAGEIEWINSKQWCSTPKQHGPTRFNFQLQPGLEAIAWLMPELTGGKILVTINNIVRNALTGKGLPLKK
jgi:hypothetical protein